jgi:hypothetical protein
MANQLDRLLEGVSENTTVHGSVARLMRNIAAEAGAAGTAINPAASTALGDSLKTHAESIASHVLANTPVIAATPPVHAKPAHDASTSAQHDPHAAHGHGHAHDASTSAQHADAQPGYDADGNPVEDHRTKRQIAADDRAAAKAAAAE